MYALGLFALIKLQKCDVEDECFVDGHIKLLVGIGYIWLKIKFSCENKGGTRDHGMIVLKNIYYTYYICMKVGGRVFITYTMQLGGIVFLAFIILDTL